MNKLTEICGKHVKLIDHIEVTYGKMCNMVDKIINDEFSESDNNLIFSISEYSNDDDDLVKIPNLRSDEPVFIGKFKIFGRCYLENPTWRDIILYANLMANGDHVYLEGVAVKGGRLELYFGS